MTPINIGSPTFGQRPHRLISRVALKRIDPAPNACIPIHVLWNMAHEGNANAAFATYAVCCSDIFQQQSLAKGFFKVAR